MSAAMIYINHDIGQSLKSQALIDRSIAQLRQHGIVGYILGWSNYRPTFDSVFESDTQENTRKIVRPTRTIHWDTVICLITAVSVTNVELNKIRQLESGLAESPYHCNMGSACN